MKRGELNDLAAFAVIAAERSFTRAGVRLGMSASALSHAMRGLEQRLGTRLLSRTTRTVATTEAGERLLATLAPALADIAGAIDALTRTRDRPAGTVRITAVKHAVTSILMPMLPAFGDRYPDIRVEIDVDDGFTDIVADRFDAGIRFGGSIAQDMIALRVGPELRFAVVGSPAYFARVPAPARPQDLTEHQCIVHRIRGTDGVYPWRFTDGERSFQVRVAGSLMFNDGELILAAAVAGRGLAYAFADQAEPFIRSGALVGVLARWCRGSTGYEIYYPGRRHNPPALTALIDALRPG